VIFVLHKTGTNLNKIPINQPFILMIKKLFKKFKKIPDYYYLKFIMSGVNGEIFLEQF
jgi:hypothetical protein